MNNETDFTVRFKTKDGILLMEKKTNSIHYFPVGGNTFDEEFIDYSLAIDCRQRGVKLVSKTITKSGIDAIVSWL